MMSPNSTVGPIQHQQNSMSPHNSISTPLSQVCCKAKLKYIVWSNKIFF